MSEQDIIKKTTGINDDELAAVIGQRIRSRREELDITATQLHEMTGIARTTLSNYELGKHQPKASHFLKLCRSLDITPNYLLEGYDRLDREKTPGASYLDIADETKKMLRMTFAIMSLDGANKVAVERLIATLAEAQLGRERLLILGKVADVIAEGVQGSGAEEMFSSLDGVEEMANKLQQYNLI